MKNLILGLLAAIVWAIAWVSVANAAVFLPSVTISSSSAVSFSTAIDKFLDAYVANHTTAQLETKFSDVEDAITTILSTRAMSDRSRFILEYIRFRVKDWLQVNDDAENNDDDNNDNGDQARSIDVDDYENGLKMILAGVESVPVVEFELTASLEKMDVINFSIIASSSDFGDSIQYVRVYNEEGVLIGTDRPEWTTANFDNTNLRLNVGTNKVYVTLQPYQIGNSTVDAPQKASFTLRLTTNELVGVTSHHDVTNKTVNNTEDVITVAPIVISSISLVNEYNGLHADGILTNGVENDLAILKVWFKSTTNTDTDGGADLNALLQTFTFRLISNFEWWGDFALRRLDRSSGSIHGEISWGADGDDNVVFLLDEFSNSENEVEAWESAYFMISWEPILDDDDDNSAKIELDNEFYSVIEYNTTDDDSEWFGSDEDQPSFLWSVTIQD